MDYLPITVQMKSRHCLIVGGGEVAARKLKHMLHADAKVTLVSPEYTDEVLEIAEKHEIRLVHEVFSPEHINGFYLVIAATDDRMVNRQVSIAAQQQNIWVNVVDDLELSTFIMPAVIDRSPLLIAISSSGVAPVLARKIREKIEWLLPDALGSLLERLKLLRPKVKKKFSSLKEKRSFSEWYIESAIQDSKVLEKNEDSILEFYQQQHKPEGIVYLVGAGPGDPELLTIKSLKIIQKADVVLYDALVSQEILQRVRKDATLVHVGKRAKCHYVHQDQTNQMLVDYAQQGLSVVRLKGGDPFIFGRGGEELQFLTQHNIRYEVVPGITAAAGCAAYSGIPLTHRDHAQSIRFVTGHEKSSKNSLDWNSLAQAGQTLVFYMGLMRNQQITDSLIKHGRNPSTPVALIEKGTTKNQRTVIGQLNELPQLVEKYEIKSPSLIVVGEVAELANELDWFKDGELISSNNKIVAKNDFGATERDNRLPLVANV
ncbi:uroporphyrinogen-III C-methyltransferase [Aliikangiella marina]|uniref:Siroheme synthase n=1 Tax=Aliikangiella marina TaxID=1712262 RepID=A0A545T2N2_9GAMM|nr:siroheme synthase CysG [Aliikangiella marina]TQV71481.1 uroporphyrinogen-III C-methyltransferase [Aliikangiella marina]